MSIVIHADDIRTKPRRGIASELGLPAIRRPQVGRRRFGIVPVKALEIVVTASMAEAEAALRPALDEQGFGVFTEIDVAATLNAKLGVGREPLKILGVSTPHAVRGA